MVGVGVIDAVLVAEYVGVGVALAVAMGVLVGVAVEVSGCCKYSTTCKRLPTASNV